VKEFTFNDQELKDLHNSECEVYQIVKELSSMFREDHRLCESADRALRLFDKAMDRYHKAESQAMHNWFDYCDEWKRKLGVELAIWSIQDVDFEEEHDWAHLADANSDLPNTITVATDGWSEQQGTAIVCGRTWADLYVAADQAIRASSDHHHVFIEGFAPTGKGRRLEIIAGS
jgi:hypothetical protein